MFLRVIALCFVLTVCGTPLLAADEAPAWLQQAALIKVPTYEKEVPAVVLQNEQAVTVSEDGHITTVTTYAVRILLREGRAFAEADEVYLTNSGKVRELHAWLIRPNGTVRKYDKDDVARPRRRPRSRQIGRASCRERV